MTILELVALAGGAIRAKSYKGFGPDLSPAPHIERR